LGIFKVSFLYFSSTRRVNFCTESLIFGFVLKINQLKINVGLIFLMILLHVLIPESFLQRKAIYRITLQACAEKWKHLQFYFCNIYLSANLSLIHVQYGFFKN